MDKCRSVSRCSEKCVPKIGKFSCHLRLAAGPLDTQFIRRWRLQGQFNTSMRLSLANMKGKDIFGHNCTWLVAIVLLLCTRLTILVKQYRNRTITWDNNTEFYPGTLHDRREKVTKLILFHAYSFYSKNLHTKLQSRNISWSLCLLCCGNFKTVACHVTFWTHTQLFGTLRSIFSLR